MQNILTSTGLGGAAAMAPGAASSALGPYDRADQPRAARGMRFASADERDAAGVRLARQGMMLVELEGIGPSMRGQLGKGISQAIERELSLRGAAGPAIDGATDVEGEVDDQLYRARGVGAAGIAIVLGPLKRAVGPLGALDPLDCNALLRLATLASERPLALLLDETDMATAGYGEPTSLGAILRAAPRPEGATGLTPTPAPASTIIAVPVASPTPATVPAQTSAPTPTAVPAAVRISLAAPLARTRPVAPAPDPDRHLVGASVVTREEPWRSWTLQLSAAKGPQPLPVLERLFAESYMPLCNAIARGLDDPRARVAQDEFRAAFAKSYTEAFPTLAVSAKRPRMVLDVHEVAARAARLHGARCARLLLVDGMRWDLSRLIEQQAATMLGPKASITDELVLWSALPTTTIRQLETIARGLDALRAPAPLDDLSDFDPLRGRTSDCIRRVRVGPREVYKLDLVQARLQAAGADVPLALPEIAEAAAEVIARHAETLAPRTLLLVFGDHGFIVDRKGYASHGSASPEEVLCGAFGLLVGDVH